MARRTIFAAVVLVLALGAFSSRTANAQDWTVNKSLGSCTSMLCIDTPPQGPKGLDGSGGWGWNSVANKPVDTLYVNVPANLTVTVMQPSTLPYCQTGATLSITLTYSSQDFWLNPTDSGGTSGTDPYDRGGVETFSYSGDFLCHTDQSVAFMFTPKHTTNTALVTATVTINSAQDPSVSIQQASQTFPVEINKKPKK